MTSSKRCEVDGLPYHIGAIEPEVGLSRDPEVDVSRDIIEPKSNRRNMTSPKHRELTCGSQRVTPNHIVTIEPEVGLSRDVIDNPDPSRDPDETETSRDKATAATTEVTYMVVVQLVSGTTQCLQLPNVTERNGSIRSDKIRQDTTRAVLFRRPFCLHNKE